ncbi:hypothetical protein ABPG74_010444 [Tetrahymena malaccensis]
MSQCSPQKNIAGKLLLQSTALQNFGQPKNYVNDYDDLLGGIISNSNNIGQRDVNSNNLDQYIKQLSSSTVILQQEALKSIVQIAQNDNNNLRLHLKVIVSNCSTILRESIGNSTKTELKNQIFSLYEILVSKYVEESELLIGNEISLILLNIGDEQAGIRRKCHSLLLKYIRTYQNSEIVVKVFISTGFQNQNWIVRQKSINSFHSILVSESKIISWNSPDMVDLTLCSINLLNDDNIHVQKATEQLLVQFTKCEQFSVIVKKLPRETCEKLKKYVEGQQILGNIPASYQIDSSNQFSSQTLQYSNNNAVSSQQQKNMDQLSSYQHKFANFGQNIIQNSSIIPKSQSSIIHKNQANNGKDISPLKGPMSPLDKQNHTLDVLIKSDTTLQQKNNPDLHFGFINDQIFKDLLNEKDWRSRTSAIEEINSQIDNIQEFTILFQKLDEFISILIKLINDTNFKISLTALQIISKISKHEQFNNPNIIDKIAPQIVSKLGDSKVAIRTQVIKIIREHIKLFGQFKWLDACLSGLKSKNANTKEEVLSLVTQLYLDIPIMCNYNYDKVLREVAPLIEDTKTKIKIKCVDCMVIVTMKNNKENCKKLIASILNKVYNDMFVEKLQQKIQEKAQEENYVSSNQNSIYSIHNKTNESFKQRENDLKFNFIDSQGNLAQSSVGSFNFNYKQFDQDVSHTNSFRTQMTSVTPEKYKMGYIPNQNQSANISSYNPTQQGFAQQTSYTNTQSQFGYPFDHSNSNIFGSIISPMQTQNRILSQNEMIDISLFSQITEDGMQFRSNNQQRDFSSYSVYRQNPNSYSNFNYNSANKQPYSSSSSVRGYNNQDQLYQQSSMNEIGGAPDSRFSQRTTNTMSTSSNTMFPQIMSNQNKSGYNAYSHGVIDISTSSSSRSAVKSGLSQSNNLNPILGQSQLSGVEQLKLSRQNIRGGLAAGNANHQESSNQSSISNTPYGNKRGNSASFTNNQVEQIIQKDYSPLKTNVEDVSSQQKNTLPPLPPSRNVSQTEQKSSEQFQNQSFALNANDKTEADQKDLSKPKLQNILNKKKKNNQKPKKKSKNKKTPPNKADKLKDKEELEQDSQIDNEEDNSQCSNNQKNKSKSKNNLKSQSQNKETTQDDKEQNEVDNEEVISEKEDINNEEQQEQEEKDEEEEEEEEQSEQSEVSNEEEEEVDAEDEDEEVEAQSESEAEEDEEVQESNSEQEEEEDEKEDEESENEVDDEDEEESQKEESNESEEQEQDNEEEEENEEVLSKQKDSYLSNLDEFSMSTFDKQIKENNQINQSSQPQNPQKPNNNPLGKVALKNKEFNPPLNLYKGNINSINNIQEEQEEKTPSQYQYKPYLIKKSKRVQIESNQNAALSGNNESQTANISQQAQTSNSDSNNNNLVIESREYIFKNPPIINEDPNENSPNSLSTKQISKNLARKHKRNSGSISNKDEIQEVEEEDEKKILKPNLRNLKKKSINKQITPSEPQLTQQPSQKYSAFDAQKQSYLTKQELEPLQNPEQTLKHVIADLKIDDWSRQFDGLNNLRRINQHHSEILQNQNTLHNLITEVLKLVENLRSSLAKNAMITLTELSEKLKRTLDTESESIVTKLLKKGLDSNSFILEEVKNALITVSQNCSEYKIISIIASKYQHKAISFKINIALMINTLVEKFASKILQMKEVEKLIYILSLYTMDGALEVRTYSKKTFSMMLNFNSTNKSEIDKILVKVLSDQQYQKIKQFIEKEYKNPEQLYITGSTQNKTIKASEKNSSSLAVSANSTQLMAPSVQQQNTQNITQKTYSSQSSIQNDAQQTNEIEDKELKLPSMNTIKMQTGKQTQSMRIKEPSEFDNIPSYFSLCESQDWKQRIEGVSKLTDLAQTYADQLAKSKYSNKYFDNFMNLLNDSNTKVSNQALTSFLNVVSQLKNGIEGNIPIVFNSVCQAIGSTQSSNKLLGEQIYAKITDIIDSSLLFSQLCNGASFAPIKAKQLIIKTLIDQGQTLYEKKGPLYTKQITSVINKLLEENKPELRPICKQLIIQVNQIIGNQIFDGISQSKKKFVQEMIASN